MRQLDLASMRSLPLFRDANAALLEELLKDAHLQYVPKQRSLIKEGEKPNVLHVVTEGTVELFAMHDDRETTIDVVGTGAPLALAAVVSDTVSLYSARPLASSQVLMLPAQAVRAACGRDAAFSLAVLDELADRYRGSIRALKNMKMRTSAERLANWILRAVAARGNGPGIELTCDKRILASHLGMTPENFSRNLALLTKYGVRNAGRDIFIDNPLALAQFAKPNALLDS